jgi:hypothetical protein
VRALRAAVAAGIPVKRVDIENGKIAVVMGEPDEPNAGNVEKNEWDEVLAPILNLARLAGQPPRRLQRMGMQDQ